MTQLFNDTDIFDRPPRAVARQLTQQARITCRACNLGVLVPLDHPVLICPPCLDRPAATRAWVLRDIQAIQAKELALLAAWDAVREPLQAFWDKIQDAGHTAATDARARQAHPTYARLLDAEAAYLTALIPLAAERERLERAIEELDTCSC